MMKYTVQKGDTLSAIAVLNNTTVNEIVKLNKEITDPNKIKVGQIITLPDKNEPEKTNYSALGKKVEKCLSEIEQLPSFKAVMNALK